VVGRLGPDGRFEIPIRWYDCLKPRFNGEKPMRAFQDQLQARRTPLPRARSLWYVGVIATSLPVIGVSQKLHVSDPKRSIVVDRQVLLRDVNGPPNAITRTAAGGFVVAGERGTAWAVATDANGTMLWMFVDPRDEQAKTQYQSNFKGIVPLSNGNFLLCGEKLDKKRGRLGLIVILDGNGHVVEQRLLFPKDDQSFFSSRFTQCLPWSDGIAVIGTAANGLPPGRSWVMKLDKSGVKEWEILDPDLANGHAVETADHNLVISGFEGAAFETKVIRINPKGDVVARRMIKSYANLLLDSVEAITTVRMITYGLDNKATLYTLNDHLEDAERSKEIGSFDAKQGRGYVLRDNSIALFGRLNNAAIAWIAESGEFYATAELDPRFKSFVANCTVPLSESRFVTVRNSVSVNIDDQGLAMSWVELK
jgi:hypothetical protein